MTVDYENEVQGPSSEQLAVISALAARQTELEQKVAAAERALKDAQKDLRKVQEVDLPDAMLAAGCRGFTLADGRGIVIKEDISASLSEGKKDAAIEWLRANGYGDIVSDDITLSFGKGKEEQARATAAQLAEQGLIPVLKTNVNTATLKSLIRELMSSGVDVPLETLGAYEWRKAVIK